MKDKWMNIGYEDDELKPYQEPSRDCTDPVRIGLCRECYYCTTAYYASCICVFQHVFVAFCLLLKSYYVPLFCVDLM